MDRSNHGILHLKSPTASFWPVPSISIHSRPSLSKVVFILIPLLYLSCSTDKVDNSSLYGKWSIVTAKRNLKETETLKDAFFIFHNDTLMSTNILRAHAEYLYERKGNQIIQKGPVDIIYEILKNSADSLILHSTINTYDFEFFALKDTSFHIIAK